MIKKVFIRTLGCQMNFRDSEVITGLLHQAGYELTDSEKEAEVVIFNTCSVRQHAEDKVWSEVGRLAKKFKVSDTCRGRIGSGSVRHLKKGQSPSGTVPLIGIVGCMAQNYKEDVFRRAAAVDFVVGPSDIDKIPRIINDIINGKRGQSPKKGDSPLLQFKIWETDGEKRPEEIYHTGFYEDKDHAYVVISEGCSNHCSYCVVPHVRGELHNRDHNAVLKEIEEALDKGATKITLLGQNVNAYIMEKIDFVKLLRLVDEIKGLKEFTFITSHPKDASAELFKVMAQCGKLKKYLHLPVQSGSDKILKLMNRGYTKAQYLKLVDGYRRIIPEGMISTDVIVGFPAETEADFLETYDLMKKVKFDSAYLFKYSPRPHTEAQNLTDDVPKPEKERRHKILLDFQKMLYRNTKNAIAACLAALCMIVVLSSEALAVFDNVPRSRRKKVVQKEAEMNYLSYPQERFLIGKYEEVFSNCQKVLDYPPARNIRAEILYLMGLCCIKMDRFLEARSYFNDIILMDGKKSDLEKNACLGIADAYFLEKRFNKACGAYQQVLAKYPDIPETAIIYYKLADTLSQLGRDGEARHYLDKVRKEFPFSFEARLDVRINKGGYYSVQAGCFNEKENADKFCERLVKEGFDAYISESENNEEPRYRVKVGKFHSRDEAEAMENRLKNAGYPTKVCQ